MTRWSALLSRQEREDGNSAASSAGARRVRGNPAVRVNPVAERARDRSYMRLGISQAVVSSLC